MSSSTMSWSSAATSTPVGPPPVITKDSSSPLLCTGTCRLSLASSIASGSVMPVHLQPACRPTTPADQRGGLHQLRLPTQAAAGIMPPRQTRTQQQHQSPPAAPLSMVRE